MASIVREELARTDDARSLFCDLFRSEADLLPDLDQRLLRVNIHPMSNPRSNRANRRICWTTSTRRNSPDPATNLRIVARSPARPQPRTRLHIKIP